MRFVLPDDAVENAFSLIPNFLRGIRFHVLNALAAEPLAQCLILHKCFKR